MSYLRAAGVAGPYCSSRSGPGHRADMSQVSSGRDLGTELTCHRLAVDGTWAQS